MICDLEENLTLFELVRGFSGWNRNQCWRARFPAFSSSIDIKSPRALAVQIAIKSPLNHPEDIRKTVKKVREHFIVFECIFGTLHNFPIHSYQCHSWRDILTIRLGISAVHTVYTICNPMQSGWDTHQKLAVICAFSLIFNEIALHPIDSPSPFSMLSMLNCPIDFVATEQHWNGEEG